MLGRILVARWLPGYFTGEQETATRLEHRFGPGTRRLVSASFLVTRFLGDGVRIYAGAIPLALQVVDPVSIAAMGGITILYTYFGGLKAVVWADVSAGHLSPRRRGGALHRLADGGRHGGTALPVAAGGELEAAPSTSVSTSTATYTFVGGLISGAMLGGLARRRPPHRPAAPRHQVVRQRPASLIGSGIVVIGQFLLFLLAGSGHLGRRASARGNACRPDFSPTFIAQALAVAWRGS
ncbi:MAG: hypothetical protein R2882_13470 [Gemmatimonadales bacterium]